MSSIGDKRPAETGVSRDFRPRAVHEQRGEGSVRARLWLLAASAAVAAVFVGPGLAGAGGFVKSPDNETATAWFVQLSGSPVAKGGSAAALANGRQSFYSAAAAAGLDVKQRYSYDTLFNGVSVSVSE